MEKLLIILVTAVVQIVMGYEMNCTHKTSDLMKTLETILICTEPDEVDAHAPNLMSDLYRSPQYYPIFSAVCEKMMHNVSATHHNPTEENPKLAESRPTRLEIWLYGNLCVLGISVCSLFGSLLAPLQGTRIYNTALTVLIGLAVGSLSGSATFHLIPQAFGVMGSEDHPQYLHIALTVWLGIWIFFQVEVILKIIEKHKNIPHHSHSHVSEGTVPMEMVAFINRNGDTTQSEVQIKAITNNVSQEGPDTLEISARKNVYKTPCDDSHPVRAKKQTIAPVAYMVVFGDAIHNFIDGVSIGAAFTDSIWTGVSLSIAVFCEELPHELGDFAVMLNSGMSVKLAVCSNFLSACTCFVGFAVGVLLGEISASKYIFGFAAGMFLYISLVDMIPEMNHVATDAMDRGWKSGCLVLLQQNIGIGIGVIILYVLALYQEQINV